MEVLSSGCIFQPVTPQEDVTAPWSNDWIGYRRAQEWHEQYGGMRWYFNDVLHLPGMPLLVMQRPGSRSSSAQELVKLGSSLYVHTGSYDQTLQVREQFTLEDVLSWLQVAPDGVRTLSFVFLRPKSGLSGVEEIPSLAGCF